MIRAGEKEREALESQAGAASVLQAHGGHGPRDADSAGHSSGHQLALSGWHLVPRLLLTAPYWPPNGPQRTIPPLS